MPRGRTKNIFRWTEKYHCIFPNGIIAIVQRIDNKKREFELVYKTEIKGTFPEIAVAKKEAERLYKEEMNA